MLLLLIAMAIPAQAAVSDGGYSLTFLKDGKLSLDAQGVPLGKLLSHLQAETKLTYHISKEYLDKSIYVSFRSLSVHMAVRKILHGINHACILNPNGQVSEIFIFSGSDTPHQVNSNPQAPSKRFPSETEPALQQETSTTADTSALLPKPPTEVLEALKGALAPTLPPGSDIRGEK